MATEQELKDYENITEHLKDTTPRVVKLLGREWFMTSPSEVHGPLGAHLRILPEQPHNKLYVSVEGMWDGHIDPDFTRPFLNGYVKSIDTYYPEQNRYKFRWCLLESLQEFADTICFELKNYFEWLDEYNEFLTNKKIEQKKRLANKVLAVTGGKLVVDEEQVLIDAYIKHSGTHVFIECLDNGNVNYKFTSEVGTVNKVFEFMQHGLS